jgi:hypothetical protein
MSGSHSWTAAEVFALGVRTDVPTAGEIVAGWGPSESYKAHARGQFPVPVIKVGRRLIVPVAHILQLLGLPEAPVSPGELSTTGLATAASDAPGRR